MEYLRFVTGYCDVLGFFSEKEMSCNGKIDALFHNMSLRVPYAVLTMAERVNEVISAI